MSLKISSPRTGISWPVFVPVLLTIGLGICQYRRAESISHDGVLFIRYARQIVGELPPPNREHVLAQRSAWAGNVMEQLCTSIPALAVVELEHQHPGYPFLLLAVQRTLGRYLAADPVVQWACAGQLASLLGGCLLTVAVFMLGRSLLDESAGLAAAVILATVPTFVHMSCDVLSDAPGLAFLVLSTLFAVRLLEGGTWTAALGCGLCGALGYLFRPEEVQASVLTGAVLIWRVIAGSGPGRVRSLQQGMALALPLVVLCLPYVFIKGSLLTKKAHLFRAAQITQDSTGSAGGTPAAQADTAMSSQAGSLQPRTSGPLAGYRKFFIEWSRNLGYFFHVFVLHGLLAKGKELRQRPSHRFVWSIALINFIVLPCVLFKWNGYLDQRHVMPTVVLTTSWCWLALRELAKWWANRISRRRISDCLQSVWVSRGIVGISAVAFSIVGLSRPLNSQRIGFRLAGEWLRGRVSDGHGIIDPELLSGFYAELDQRNYWDRHPRFSAAHLQQLLSFRAPVDYVVLSDRYVRMNRIDQNWHAKLRSHSLRQVCSFPLSSDLEDRTRVRVYRVEVPDWDGKGTH